MILLLVGLLSGCVEEAAPIEGASVPTLLGEAAGVHFMGNWTSGPCGARDYARNIRFELDGSFAGVDLVSPCPAGQTCVWSGVVGYAGVWQQRGKQVFIREIGAPTAPGSPHPTLIEANEQGNLVENGCIYTTGVTVPPGYTEVQVTPRAPGTPEPKVEEEAPAGAGEGVPVEGVPADGAPKTPEKMPAEKR